MINDDVVYGLEFYSQDHMAPGFILTLSGKEIKKLLKHLKKDLGKEAIQSFVGRQIEKQQD